VGLADRALSERELFEQAEQPQERGFSKGKWLACANHSAADGAAKMQIAKIGFGGKNEKGQGKTGADRDMHPES